MFNQQRQEQQLKRFKMCGNDYDEPDEDYLYEEWRERKSEIKWLEEQGSSWAHREFQSSQSRLENIIKEDRYHHITMMCIAYSVTQFEVFIQSSLIKLVAENIKLMENAQNIDELSKTTFKFKDLKSNTIKEVVDKHLLDSLFHNIPKTKSTVDTILGKKTSIEIAEACKVTEIRHDIVHRGGYDKKGNPIYLTKEKALECLGHMELLADAFQSEFSTIQPSTGSSTQREL